MLLRLIKQAIGAGQKAGPTPGAQGVPPPAGRGESQERAGETQQDLEELIDHAAGLVADGMTEQVDRRMRQMAAAFDAVLNPSTAPLNVFAYHVDMGGAGKVSYRDVVMDTTRFDYQAVLQAFVDSVQRWHPDATIYLATSPGSPLAALASDRVRVVPLEVASDQPMYERVNAMCAYVHSRAFNADTLFLDSDAFLNSRFGLYLDGDYDVAVTVREVPGLMPVNEGVIVARAAHPERVRAFFRRYLSTYEALREDARIRAYYGDIRKWRGGQLSLNAVAHAASPFSPYRQLTVDGIRLRVLPCDPFNYSYEYGQAVTARELREKVIVHLKGGRKSSLDGWLAYAQELDRAQHAASPEGYVEPLFALWNKEYQKPPFGSDASRREFASAVQRAGATVGANAPGSGAVLVDDMLVWFRNAAFLSDPEFVEAMGPLRDDQTLRARIWRVYTLCWAARNCLALDGDFLDVGCYDGKTVAVIERYCRFRERQDKRYWLYDMFENPPDESRKSGHGPDLFDRVREAFGPFANFRVIMGPVPESFDQGLPERIAFAQVDLNAAEPELACLEAIYDRIVPGGIVVFDDFGFRRYKRSHEMEAAFLAARGQSVWESPTGQGLLIKR